MIIQGLSYYVPYIRPSHVNLFLSVVLFHFRTVLSVSLTFLSSRHIFLLLARYVRNVSEEECMRSMYILRIDDRPTDLAFWKISNGHISAAGHPIHFMFGSKVGFSRSADRMALLPVGPNPRSRPYDFEWPYLWNGSSDPIRIWL